MSILHQRRNVKRRYLAQLEGGRCSAPHEYERASSRDVEVPADEPAPAVKAPRKRKAKAKRARKAA